MEHFLQLDIVKFWSGYLSPERLVSFVQAIFLLTLGYLLARGMSRGVHRAARKRLKAQQAVVISRILFGFVMAIVLVSTLRQVGFDLSIFVGAAGVLTVAIGFASQISASNLISGVFLLMERPFEIGETIRIGATTGEVISIDLLSTKIRTFDNQLVRLPNETIIKTELANLTRLKTRRVDVVLEIELPATPEQVFQALRPIALNQPFLVENEPFFTVNGFCPGGFKVTFGVWVETKDYGAAVTVLYSNILSALQTAGITNNRATPTQYFPINAA